jgi:eukaryotic-like serine/threonine-protein kinase
LPDVKGAPRGEAERALEEAGFKVKVETRESSAENENLVTGQEPLGKTEQVGSTIMITVGKGPAPVVVPSINNQALGGTDKVLQEAGLKLGNQTEAPSDQVPAGHIVEQRPAAGTQVEPGSTVDVVLSSGPNQPSTSNFDDAT